MTKNDHTFDERGFCTNCGTSMMTAHMLPQITCSEIKKDMLREQAEIRRLTGRI